MAKDELSQNDEDDLVMSDNELEEGEIQDPPMDIPIQNNGGGRERRKAAPTNLKEK